MVKKVKKVKKKKVSKAIYRTIFIWNDSGLYMKRAVCTKDEAVKIAKGMQMAYDFKSTDNDDPRWQVVDTAINVSYI